MRVKLSGGLVNLDIINTPLTPFFAIRARGGGKAVETAHGIHMLMCNSVSMTMGWKEEAVRWLHLHGNGIPGLFGVKCDAHSQRGVRKFTASEEHQGMNHTVLGTAATKHCQA